MPLDRRLVGGVALLLGLALLPFALCTPLPLVDYPNHLARAFIIAHLETAEHLRRYYAVEWSLVANLALDLAVPWLARWMGVNAAMELFTALGPVLLVSGGFALQYALYRGISLAPWFLFFAFYSRPFLWGFVNYVFALGLCVWACALWVLLRGRSTWLRVPLFFGLSLLLMLCHLHPFGLFGLFVGGYELGRARMEGKTLFGAAWATALRLLPVALACGLFMASSSTSSLGGNFSYQPAINKFLHLFSGAFYTYSMVHALLVMALLALTVGYCAWRGRARVLPEVRLGLGLCVAAYLAMPFRMFDSQGADSRLVVAMFALWLSASWLELPAAALRRFVAVYAALLLSYMAIVGSHWQAAGKEYAAIRAMLARVEPGARLLGLVNARAHALEGGVPLRHIMNMAVVDRQAFVNSLFAVAGQQVLAVRHQPDPDYFRSPSQLLEPGTDLAGLPLAKFDYLLLLDGQEFATPPGLQELARHKGHALYRIPFAEPLGK